MRLILPLTLSLVAAACSRHSGSSPTVFAAATIGPEGGEVAVTGGNQQGLRLTVPAGAVAAAVEFRIVDVRSELPPGAVAASLSPPADAFRIEPADLYLDQAATLRMPYSVQRLGFAAPGNVRVRQTRNGESIDREPVAVDVAIGRVELSTRTMGVYQVIQGPQVGSVSAYMPPPADAVALTGGWSFAVEAVPTDSPFVGLAALRWHLVGPGRDELLYFDGGKLVGREAPSAWRELWNEAYDVWQNPALVQTFGITTSMQVEAPIGLPPFGGAMTATGTWAWDEPRPVVDALAYDVVRLRIALAWQRNDLGTGQREYQFWFAPAHGLLAFAEDGVVHERTSP